MVRRFKLESFFYFANEPSMKISKRNLRNVLNPFTHKGFLVLYFFMLAFCPTIAHGLNLSGGIPETSSTSFNWLKPKQTLRSNGNLYIENHFASLQNPFIRSEQIYSRWQYQGSVSLLGLPFKGVGFYSTERSNAFRPNYLRFQLDGEALKEQYLSKLNRDRFHLNKSVNFNQLLLSQLESQKQRIREEISELGENDSLKRKLKYPSFKKFEISDSLNADIPGFSKPSWQDTLSTKHRDSLRHRLDSIINRVDSIYAKFQSDSAEFANLTRLIEDPGSLLADSLPEGKKWMKYIMAVREFEVGLTSPVYNELTLNGIGVRGAHGVYQINEWGIGITAGKAMNLSDQFDPTASAEFSKNLVGFLLDRRIGKTGMVQLSGFNAKDDKSIERKELNQALSIGYSSTTEKTEFSVLGATSIFKDENTSFHEAVNARQVSPWENKAVTAELFHKPFTTTKLGARVKYVGPNYKTIGNPFLRTNFTEKEFSWEQKWAKGRLKSRIFYKDLKTNKSEFTEFPGSIRGAGVQVNSNFKKGINFFFLYSPFEQGNNHPDTAFRTLNKSNILSGGLSYMLVKKQFMYFSQAMLTQSVVSGDQLPSTRTLQYALEQTLDFDGRHQFMLNLSRFQTVPNVDTLNFSSANFFWKKLVKQHLKIGMTAKAIKYSPNSNIMGAAILCDFRLLKVLSCSSSFGADQVQNWWGVEGKKLAVTANLGVRYSW